MLWILASVAIALLCYEAATLVTAVLLPLLGNPGVLQTDFHYYYDAARRFSADSRLLYMFSDDVIAGFAYPPPAIVPFLLLSSVRLGPALIVMTLASYTALLVSVRLWTDYLRRQGIAVDRTRLLAITLIVLALGPTYMNAVFGQVNAFVLASSVGFIALAGAAPIVAGIVLALGAWLKLYPALLLLVGAWERRAWRAIGYALAAGLVVAAVSLIWLPLDSYHAFATFVLPTRSGKTAIHITNQSLVAFLERFRFEPHLFLNWTGQQAVTVSRAFAALNFVAFGAAVAALHNQVRSPHRIAHAGAALMAMVAIFAPLGWGHTYVMVLPLVILRLAALQHAGLMVTTLISAAIVALMIPAGRHLPIDMFPSWLQNVVYSRYLLASVALILIPSTSIGTKSGAGAGAIAPA